MGLIKCDNPSRTVNITLWSLRSSPLTITTTAPWKSFLWDTWTSSTRQKRDRSIKILQITKGMQSVAVPRLLTCCPVFKKECDTMPVISITLKICGWKNKWNANTVLSIGWYKLHWRVTKQTAPHFDDELIFP